MGRLLRWAIVAVAVVAAPARAGIIPQSMKDPMPPARFALDAGGGSLAYVSGNLGGGSGAWTAVAGWTPWRYVTVEASYTGASGNANGGGNLVATIVEGNLRINPIPGYRASPYLIGGVGWGAFHESRSPSDNSTLTVPIGGGLEMRLTDRFAFGARVTYRVVAFDRVGPVGASADDWSTLVRFGAKL